MNEVTIEYTIVLYLCDFSCIYNFLLSVSLLRDLKNEIQRQAVIGLGRSKPLLTGFVQPLVWGVIMDKLTSLIPLNSLKIFSFLKKY